MRFMSAVPRYCCKSRKLQRHEFFAKTRGGRRLLIRIPSIALPKSPVSLTRGDMSPHIFTPKTRLQPAEFLITCAKRLLQQYPPKADLKYAPAPPVLHRSNQSQCPIASPGRLTAPQARHPTAVTNPLCRSDDRNPALPAAPCWPA